MSLPDSDRRLLGASLTLVTLLMTGCSTMSKDECLAVDWRTIGYEDGVAGFPGDRIAQHRKACAKYGVRADLAEYQAGREQGLREYCRPANGYRLGASGAGYGGICPAPLERAFLSSYEIGHQLYVLQARVSSTEAQLHARRRELDSIEHDIAANALTAVSHDSSDKDRADAVIDTAKLAERAGRLKEEIRQLQEDRVQYQRDLDDYQTNQPPIT